MNQNEAYQIYQNIKKNISNSIVGNENCIDLLLVAAFAKGHVLLEDNPGTGKTTLAKAFSKSIEAMFKRVQLTPDLMPLDIVGVNVYQPKQGDFHFVPGPIFSDILLADEINRTTPRTQSALLEAMEEKQVTVDGETKKLCDNFMLIATENQVETLGTYPLPEAQLDRFMMKLSMEEMTAELKCTMLENGLKNQCQPNFSSVCNKEQFDLVVNYVSQIYITSCVIAYIVDVANAISRHEDVELGISPRGLFSMARASQAFAMIHGRDYVIPDDVRELAPHVFAHRIKLFGGDYSNEKSQTLIRDIVANIPVPVENWEDL